MRLRIGVVYAIGTLLAACGDQPAGHSLPDPQPPTSQPSDPLQTDPQQPDRPPSDPQHPDPQHPNPVPDPFLSDPLEPTPPPLDERKVQTAATPPLAISGGTLLLSADERFAVISDPDRDRVSIVDLEARALVAHVALEPGDEPGRLVEGAAGQVHVALRRAGAVATIDPVQATLLARTAVCAAPRGLAFDSDRVELLVACAGGELVRMPAAGGSARTVARLGSDLRDVMMYDGRVLVTRFRSSEVLRVNEATGEALASRPIPSRVLFNEPSTGALRADTMSAQVAYRLRPLGAESLLLSQVARDGEIELGDDTPVPDTVVAPPPQPVSSSPYGEGGGGGNVLGRCGGVVQSLLSRVDADGAVVQSRRIPGVLIVDVAHSPVSGAIAVAQAGALDPQNPAGDIVFGSALASSVLVFSDAFAAQPDATDDEVPCAPADEALDIGGQVTAVVITSRELVLAQSREPAFLAIADRRGEIESIALGGASLADTGHALFHRNAGAGVACASCHAEGGDDGHTWRFSAMGLRRTQSLHVGLRGSAPFHWAGDERDFEALVSDVMVGRMGGARQTPERVAALEHWIYALQAPPTARPIADEAAQRGKLLFEGEAQCNTCHGGSALSSNETRAVGKGEALQVPSLVGVAYRRPLMHDGCAADLRARFDADCGGGDSHGKTSQLNETQLGDLIAYLETL